MGYILIQIKPYIIVLFDYCTYKLYIVSVQLDVHYIRARQTVFPMQLNEMSGLSQICPA